MVDVGIVQKQLQTVEPRSLMISLLHEIYQRIFHPRNPKASPLWQIFDRHYDDFEKNYTEKFEKKYGLFRPAIGEVVRSYLKCGDLKEGVAQVFFINVKRCP